MPTKINDPYATLGVKPTATDDEIKKAYRALVKKLHPDINPGDSAREERFKEVTAAHSFLSDKEQRRRFDAGEIDATGTEKPERSYYRDFARGAEPNRYEAQGEYDDLGDIFSRAFRDSGQGRGPNARMRGGDLRFHLQVDFRDAINGAKRRVTTPDGGRLDISIPAGIKDGQSLRLAGRGLAGINGGPAGDALIEISVMPDRIFTREADDILLDLPIAIDEAVLGASIEVPTVMGLVKLKVPAGSGSGRVMRLKGRGAKSGKGKAGDQLITLKIVLPDTENKDLTAAMEALRKAGGYDARAHWEGTAK